MILATAYQVFEEHLSLQQTIFLNNVAITSYQLGGLINLPQLKNDMINFRLGGLYTSSSVLLQQHSVQAWLDTLDRIKYKENTIRWFHCSGFNGARLEIEEYIPKGLLPTRLFPLNSRGVHPVAQYWAIGVNPEDYIRPWIMTKPNMTLDGFHEAESPSIDEPMDVEPRINRHKSPVVEPAYVPSEEEVDWFLRPTSPPYDPEQAVRDRQVLCPLPVPPSSPPAVSPSPPILKGDATHPIIVDEASPQSPALPFATESKWPADATDSENVWPNPPSVPPTTPTDPATRHYGAQLST